MNDFIKERNEAFSDDLISRQAAIDAINEHLEFVTSGLGNDSEVKKIYKIAYNHTIDVISILPDIQPEQKIGHWIICSDGYYPYCSQCLNEPKNRIMTKYCGECGAKMESEVTE